MKSRNKRGPARRNVKVDPLDSARAADLRYVDDSGPGITRKAKGGRKAFTYHRVNGTEIKEAATLKRIASLVIPPAWKNVWICPSPDGHIQATGRDARGRKQYRYHPRFRQIRDETKYERMLSFAEALPKIRARIDQDLGRPSLDREKVLATIVRLLEITLIRVGNEEYARENESFGLTTLRERHVDVSGSTIKFRFRGKSGVTHAVEVHDKRVAKVVARCTDLPGQDLFQYVDDNEQVHSVQSNDVNAYLKEISGSDFTAKDFRTWAGTVLAARELRKLMTTAEDLETEESATALKKNVTQAIKEVSSRLGNTAAVCKKCYVHPEIVGAYLDRALTIDPPPPTIRPGAAPIVAALSAHELGVLSLLHGRLAERRRAAKAKSPPAPLRETAA